MRNKFVVSVDTFNPEFCSIRFCGDEREWEMFESWPLTGAEVSMLEVLFLAQNPIQAPVKPDFSKSLLTLLLASTKASVIANIAQENLSNVLDVKNDPSTFNSKKLFEKAGVHDLNSRTGDESFDEPCFYFFNWITDGGFVIFSNIQFVFVPMNPEEVVLIALDALSQIENLG